MTLTQTVKLLQDKQQFTNLYLGIINREHLQNILE